MPYRYSRWDGRQAGFELDAEQVLAEVADDLLYHGDLHAALRRLSRAACGLPMGGTWRACASCWSGSPGAGGRSWSATSCPD